MSVSSAAGLLLDQQDAACWPIYHFVLREHARLESLGNTVVRRDDQAGMGRDLPPPAMLGSGVISVIRWIQILRGVDCG
jgi:hypothetical protein